MINVIDTLKSLGDFPVVNSSEVQHGDKRLNTVISNIQSDSSSKADKSYVDSEVYNKADKTFVETELSKKADNSSISELSDRVSDNENNISIQTARIDSIVSTPSGSTEGNSELIDIRVGADGTTYTDAGTAVRSQVLELKNETSNCGYMDLSKSVDGSLIETTGVIESSSLTKTSDYISFNKNENIDFSFNFTSLVANANRSYCFYDNSKTFISGSNYNPSNKGFNVNPPQNARYIRISYDKNISEIKFHNYNAYLNGIDNEIKDELRDLSENISDYQYLPNISDANKNKYWQSDGTMGDSSDFYAFNPVHLNSGKYYYRNFVTAFVFFKSDDGTITYSKMGGLSDSSANKTFTITKSGTIYITTKGSSTINVNNVILANYDYPIAKSPVQGINKIDLSRNTELDNMLKDNLLSLSEILDGHYWNNPTSIGDTDGYAAFNPVFVKKGWYYFTNITSYFSFFKPSDGSDYYKPFESATNNMVEFKNDGWLYISLSKSDYDVNKATISKFFGTYGIFNSIDSYSRITDTNKNYLFNNTFNASYATDVTIDGKNVSILSDDSGILSPVITTISSAVKVHIDLTLTAGTSNTRVYVQINQDGGGVKFVKKDEFSSLGNHVVDFTFDAASYSVYENAISYCILVYSGAGTKFTVNSFTAYNSETYEASDLYSSNLSQLLSNVVNKVDSISTGTSSSSSTVLSDYNGNKYGLLINADGSLTTYSHVPKKYAVMGNSITCGMDNTNEHGGMFGMAATSASKDWVAYVDTAIKAKNPTATYTRIYSSPFEHSESTATAESWIDSNKSKFTSDLDLIIIEMGDNVNTSDKKSVFDTSFGKLISEIRKDSPKCRIVVVGVWFCDNAVKSIMTRECKRYSVEFVDITDLNTTVNQATVGDTVTYRDGTTGTISQLISTHPGDTGMKLIGERVIDKLDM